MPSYYEKYLDDIIEERKRKPFEQMASQRVQQLAPEFQRTRRNVSDVMRREGASPLAKARFALDAEGRITDQVGKIYSQAEIQEVARQEQLGGQQREAEFAVEKEKDAKKRAEKSRTQQVWKSAAEILGTVGGTLATGGNLAAGLSIGKAAGGVADVVTGLDKTYESPESIAQGGANILSGIISTVDTVGQENFISGVDQNISKFAGLNPQQRQEFMFRYQKALTGSNREKSEFIKWLEMFGNNGTESIEINEMSNWG